MFANKKCGHIKQNLNKCASRLDTAIKRITEVQTELRILPKIKVTEKWLWTRWINDMEDRISREFQKERIEAMGNRQYSVRIFRIQEAQ